MSSVINPVGPEEPATYWRRRILVAVAVLIALVVVMFVMKSCSGGTDPVAQPTVQPTQSAQPSESPSSSASSGANAAACNNSDIGVAVKDGEIVVQSWRRDCLPDAHHEQRFERMLKPWPQGQHGFCV